MHELPVLLVTTTHSAELCQPSAAVVLVPVVEVDRPGAVKSLITASCMSAALSCTRSSFRWAANGETAEEVLHQ